MHMAKKSAVASTSFLSHPSQQHRLPYRSIIAMALFAIFSSLSFPRIWKRKEVTTDLIIRPQMKQPTMGQAVKYVEVPTDRENDVKRYAAIQQSDKEPISIKSWMTIVSSNSSVGIQASSDLSDIIANSPFAAVLFEMPGTSWQSSDDDPFEFVIVNSPTLQFSAANNPDRYIYAEHFKASLRNEKKNTVCSFPNRGGTARLISPLPQTNVDDSAYSHLASFVRNAPKTQITEFWKLSAYQYLKVLKQKHDQLGLDAKTWFSTHGTGVSWLHLRLDRRPKYYSYRAFK